MRIFVPLTLALLSSMTGVAASQTPPGGARAAAPTPNIEVGRTPFLPDSEVVARVGPRTLTAFDFRQRYFDILPTQRTSTDSAGRLEFLNNMIDKEVMGLTALEVNRPLTFDDRTKVRAHVRNVLGNVLYQRLVTDSVKVTDAEVARAMKQFGYEQHLRSIRVATRATAERVRNGLIRGELTWSEATRRYSKDVTPPADGDVGWVRRAKLRGEYAIRAFDLLPGSKPEVIQDYVRFYVVQCIGRRPVKARAEAFERMVANRDVADANRRPVVDRFYQKVRAFAGAQYDTANIRWTANRFREEMEHREALPPGTVDLVGVIPDFAPEDTARVLVRIKQRKFTLGEFLYDYRNINAMVRNDVTDLESFVLAIDGPAFVAERMELAEAMGIARDPLAVKQIEHQREQLLVEHLFQDSVVNRINVTPDMRRAYYRDHQSQFVTIPKVRYARFVRHDRSSADELMQRLRAGESAQAIMRVDSLRGDDTTGSVREQLQTDPDEYQKVLFEELRPGQTASFGPDREGKFLIFQLLEFLPERAMSYEEVVGIVDESVQNIEAERILRDFLDRNRARYAIEAHPERLMHIRLSDPWEDQFSTAVQ